MSIIKTYFKRKLMKETLVSDVYEYTKIPIALCRQIIMIIEDVFGDERKHYDAIKKMYTMELGVFSLLDAVNIKENYKNSDSFSQIQLYLLNESSIDFWLSLVEIIFQYIESELVLQLVKLNLMHRQQWLDSHLHPDKAIEELNYRFKEHCLGYEYIDGIIIRIDSKEIHKEVVKPALAFLASDPIYEAVNVNYRKAFEHYRLQKYDECLVNSSKAFEGCMKAICTKRGWSFDDKRDTASKLINICSSNQLFPEYLTEQLTHLRCLMETVVTPRNRVGAHHSNTYASTPKEVASYVLHFSASTIVFLIECEKVLR